MPPLQPDAQSHQPQPRQQPQQLQTRAEYPKPIPPQKLEISATLLAKYRFEENLGRQSQSSNYLHPPNGSRPPPSIASDPRSPSAATTSNYGGGPTESVVSFEGNESPSSAAANTNSSFRSYTGRVVKPRKRSALNPTAKAKAALIRYLGSCPTCRARRVPCPLEHHDIDALDRILLSRPRSHTSPEPTRRDVEPAPAAPLQRHVSDSVRPTQYIDPQSNALFGLGQNEMLSETIPIQFAAPGPQSSMATEGDILYDIHSNTNPNFDLNINRDFANLEILEPEHLLGYGGSDTWEAYQQADMIELGVYYQGWGFSCRHNGPSGPCQHSYQDMESLQLHYERHTAFTRLSPPDRYCCLSCNNMEMINYGGCLQCGNGVAIEHRVYGNIIRQQNFQRDYPDGNDHFERNNSADPFSAFQLPNNASGMGPSTGDSSSGGMGQGGYNPHSHTYQAHGPNSGSGSQGTSFETFQTPPSGNYQFRGSQYGEAVDQTRFVYWLEAPLRACRRHKLILIATALLSTVMFVVKTHDWFITKARVASHQPNLPIIAGFIGLVASFAICHTLWSMNLSARERRSQWVCEHTMPDLWFLCLTSPQRSTKCPVSEVSSSASFLRCAPKAPPRRIRGGIYL